MTTYSGFCSHFTRSPAGAEGSGSSSNSGSSVGSGSDPKAAQKKPSPMSRLGRGLGALIPAAGTRPPGSPSPSSSAPGTVTAETKLPTPVTKADTVAGASRSSGAAQAQGAKAIPNGAPSTATLTAGPAAIGQPNPSGTSPSANAFPQTDAPSSSDTPSVDQRSTWNTTTDQAIVAIPIARIQRNPRQPRERFEDAALRALADSIRQDGLLQPIVVRASRTISPTTGVQMYELIAGERRLRAFTLLGRSTIPALVQKVDDRTSAVLALIENIQREDLNPMERAHGLQKLMHEFSFSQQDLASRVGLDRSTVANLLRLNDLDPHTAGALREGAITTGHAKALLGLSDVTARKTLVARVVSEGMSVRELEQAVRHLGVTAAPAATAGRLPPTGKVISAQVADLERRISTHLGTEVTLKTGRKAGSGAITIKFGSHSQFEGLMDRIGFDLEGSDRPRGR